MERLTSNKPVSEMGMEELAYNCCYVSADGNASYRDFETNIDAREFARRLMRIYDDEDLSKDDTAFDEEVINELKYDPEIYPSALIALFYRNLWAMAQLHNRLKCYEDSEEQGLLLKVPCKVGDDIYSIPSKVNFDLNILSKHEENNRVYHQKVARISYTKNCWYVECDKDIECGTDRICIEQHFGVTWFLTKEEAEQKLEEMKKE